MLRFTLPAATSTLTLILHEKGTHTRPPPEGGVRGGTGPQQNLFLPSMRKNDNTLVELYIFYLKKTPDKWTK